MYVHMHVCMYVRRYVCMYVCMYVCLSMYLCMRVYICVYVYNSFVERPTYSAPKSGPWPGPPKLQNHTSASRPGATIWPYLECLRTCLKNSPKGG